MAAVQWSGGKCKNIQQAKAWFRHNTAEERLEANHTNPHIDKAMTKYNFSYKNLDYNGLCSAFDKRMGEVDIGRQSSGKNARVIIQSIIVYPPQGITDRATLKKWFNRVGDILTERFGDNFLDMQVDFDENHNYYDKDKKATVMSREHGHARLIPAVDGRLNGKAFSSRAAINGLNDALQDMSIKEFGCPMMDGSKKKGGRTVEQLKAESEAMQIIAAAEASANAIRRAAEDEARKIIAEAEKVRQKASDTLKRAQIAFDGMKQDVYDRGFTEYLAGMPASKDGRLTGQDFIDKWEKAYREEQREKLGLEPKRRKTGGKQQKQESVVTVKPAEKKQSQQLDPAVAARIQATLAELGYQDSRLIAEDDRQQLP